MHRWANLASRRGFTLIEVMVVLLVVGIVSVGAVIALAPASEAPVTVAMMGDVETFATIQAEGYHVRGVYAEPLDVLESGKMRLSPGVEVDSSLFSPHRVYLRVRHRASAQRCSVDLSEVSHNARNRVQCFGGTARDSVEQGGIADGGEVPIADTTAAVVPPLPPVPAIALSPEVVDPADVLVQPGETVERAFVVTNRSGSGRGYRFEFASSDPDLVALPAVPGTAIIPAGGSFQVQFRSSMSVAAGAGQLAAVTLMVEDLEEPALTARGTFAAMASILVAPPIVTPPPAADVKPESTVVLAWTVRSRSNVTRTLEVGTAADDGSLVLVSAEGLGRVRFNPGEERRVETHYRLVGPSSAGSRLSVRLTVADALAPAYRGEERAVVTTALALAPPEVTAPSDTVAAPGSTFTRSWTIRARSNATRSYSVTAASEGAGLESVELVGSSHVSVPENGSVQVSVTYRMKASVPAGQPTRVRFTARDEDGQVETSATSLVTAAEAPVPPVVVAPAAVRGYVGDTAQMVFVVRNEGNAGRRYVVGVFSSDPLVAAVQLAQGEVEVPAFSSIEIPVRISFPSGPIASLDAAVTLAVEDALAGELAGNVSATASRINRPPTVRLAGPAREYAAGEDVPFRMEGVDPDGDLVGYGIEFGDGTSASGQAVGHAYFAPGTYYVRARVVDPFGMSAEDFLTLQVIAPTIGCMDTEASNYDPNANLPGDCTYGPRLVNTEEMILTFVCDWERNFRQYQFVDVWGRMYDYWSDGTMSPAGPAYQIGYEERDLGPVTAAPYGLTCETYNDDAWP